MQIIVTLPAGLYGM